MQVARALFRCSILLLVFVTQTRIAQAQSGFVYPDEYLQQKTASRPYTSEQVERMADLGKLWGILHFFNPQMSNGTVNTDSLILPAIRNLLKDPSATGFRRCIEIMLATLGDNSTRLVTNDPANVSLLFNRGSRVPVVHRLPDSTYYISIPTLSVDAINELSDVAGLQPTEWSTAKAIIIDVRNNKKITPYDDYNFLYGVMPSFTDAIAGTRKELPVIYERRVFHDGFVSQSAGTPNIYSSGWRVAATGNARTSGKGPDLDKPVIFIYNSSTMQELVREMAKLKAAGLAHLVYEGSGAVGIQGDRETIRLADSLQVMVRLTELELGGGKPLPGPDLIIPAITDTSLDGDFIKSILRIASNPPKEDNSGVTADFVLPKPARYGDTLVPSADKRLFGLYNFWNVIHYFSPYQQYQDHSWDSIIYKYIPVFLNADDSGSYNLAVRALASETQDSHGFLGSSFNTTPARRMYGAWPPIDIAFIGGKVYVADKAKDSLNDVKLWDEIVSVDGLSVARMKEVWRKYIATSNEDTYERDVCNHFVGGPLNTIMTVQLRRDGKLITTKMQRTGRWLSRRPNTDFNAKHKTAEMLPGNIGYINMGSLRQSAVDSTMKAFANTSAIIFDIRNYPQGTAWQIAPMLTATAKKAVKFDKPYVTLDHVRGGEDKSTLSSWFTVNPSGNTPYKGKVIILCNEKTQSQAEYSIMMFQGATKCTVIGSRTAGADGNVTEVVLPGGYTISFSGLGIYYPDGEQTQRSGIRVDVQCRPTLAGLKAGRDEVLERAIQFVKNNR